MAKPNTNFPDKQLWGTWEELLLACAVHRYGTDSWDAVATELQKRSSSLMTLSGLSCKQKYRDLQRRFSQNDVVAGGGDRTTAAGIEELRRLRVAQLRREVERCDLSIVSLQLKVKRLTEEREQLRENENERGAEISNLQKNTDERDIGKEAKNEDGGEKQAGNVAGEDSDRDNRSVNESNSTDPKSESPQPDVDAKKETEPEGEPEGDVGREDSCNSVAKESDGKSERVDRGNGSGESAENGESVAETKDAGGGGQKESSDVQSWVRKEGKVGQPEELENEGGGDRSPAIRSISVESQPLIGFLEILRSHKLGTLFERRRQTQEIPNYSNLIRQYVDFETIQMRMEEGWYSGCVHKFFRDLLLLFNNAIVFFGKNSSEFLAAIELRQIVLEELARKMSVPVLSTKEQTIVSQDPSPPGSLGVKPKMRVVMVTCRKRSSLATKATPLFSAEDKKGEQNCKSVEEKPVTDLEELDKSTDIVEENHVTTTRKGERRSSFAAKSSNKTSRSQTRSRGNKNGDASSNSASSTRARSQKENMESKVEIGKEKKNSAGSGSKKKGAANFLDRMKRSSQSENVLLLESRKHPATDSEGTKATEQKGESKKGQNSGKGSGGKRGREVAIGRRSLGRPPKRAAAPPPPVLAPAAKRGRETAARGSGNAKKRSRK